jgi:hypothetical protein
MIRQSNPAPRRGVERFSSRHVGPAGGFLLGWFPAFAGMTGCSFATFARPADFFTFAHGTVGFDQT